MSAGRHENETFLFDADRDYHAAPEYHDEPPYHDASPTSPLTPKSHTSNSLLGSPTSPKSVASGLVFGAPRKVNSPTSTNPFSDLQSPYYHPVIEHQEDAAPALLPLPARALKFPKYDVLPHHGKEDQDTYYATPSNLPKYKDEDSDEESIADDEKVDPDEEEAVVSYAQTRNLGSNPQKKRSRFFSFRSCFWYLIALAGAILLGLVVATIYFTVTFKSPKVYYLGEKTPSAGTFSDAGIDFSRTVSMGFVNSNNYAVHMTELEFWPLYNGSYFGHTKKNGFEMPLPKDQPVNATLPIEMNFDYVSAKDPSGEMLKSLFNDCLNGQQVPFDIKVHGKFKLFNFVHLPVSLATVKGVSMECGDNLSSMLQQMISIRKPATSVN